MKLLVALLVALLVGCATPPPDPRIAEYLAWERNSKQMALDGQMPWTSYYSQGYDRLSQFPSSLDRNLRMQAFAQTLPYARQYEAGQISRDQFYDQRRLVNMSIQQAAAQARAQQQALDNANMANALQMMRAMQPAPIQLPMPAPAPASVNCTSYRSGNTVQTNCF